jgi:CrcB protein
VITALAVVLIGGLGAMGRFLVDSLVQTRRLGSFPLGTLVVNLGGCFVLGLLDGLGVSGRTMLLTGTAALGSYTTFSTWMLETHRPAEDGDAVLAWQNLVISLAAGFAVVALGRALGSRL